MAETTLPALLESNAKLRKAMFPDKSLPLSVRAGFYEKGIEDEINSILTVEEKPVDFILERLQLFQFFYNTRLFLQQSRHPGLPEEASTSYKRVAAKVTFAYGFAMGEIGDDLEKKAELKGRFRPFHYDSHLEAIYNDGKRLGARIYSRDVSLRQQMIGQVYRLIDQKARAYSGEAEPNKPPQQQR